jgi:hypothetical protein
MRHKDGMAMSMITGTKHSIEGKQGIQTNHAGAAMVFVGLVGLFVFYLGSNYDPTKQQLDVFGAQVQLGEAKEAKDDDSTDGQKSSKSRDDDDEQHDRNDD